MILSESFTLEVVLPAGAQDVQVHLPFEAESIDYSKLHFGTLDFTGAPTVAMKVLNANMKSHNTNFEVTYTLQPHMLLMKPLSLAAIVFAMLLAGILYARVGLREQRSKVKAE